MTGERDNHQLPPYETLLETSLNLVETSTCPYSGLPTTDHEPQFRRPPISSLLTCYRGLWGVAQNGNALYITQGYRILPVDSPANTPSLHKEIRVDFFEGGTPAPSVIQWPQFARDNEPAFREHAVEAHRRLTPEPLDVLTDVSQRSLDTLQTQPMSWFTPFDVTNLSEPTDLSPITALAHIMPMTAFRNTGVFVAPYDTAQERPSPFAAVFAPRYEYRPSAPDWQVYPDLVDRIDATVTQHAAEIHEVLSGLGGVDISKQ